MLLICQDEEAKIKRTRGVSLLGRALEAGIDAYVSDATLPIGDYHIYGALSCVVERKTPGDFKSSIEDGRLSHWLEGHEDFDAAVMLIDFPDDARRANAALVFASPGRSTPWGLGALNNANLTMQALWPKILMAQSYGETYPLWDCLKDIYHWCETLNHGGIYRFVKEVPLASPYTNKEFRTAVASLALLVGESTAKKLLRRYGTPKDSIAALLDGRAVEVPDVGKGTCKKVQGILGFDTLPYLS